MSESTSLLGKEIDIDDTGAAYACYGDGCQQKGPGRQCGKGEQTDPTDACEDPSSNIVVEHHAGKMLSGTDAASTCSLYKWNCCGRHIVEDLLLKCVKEARDKVVTFSQRDRGRGICGRRAKTNADASWGDSLGTREIPNRGVRW